MTAILQNVDTAEGERLREEFRRTGVALLPDATGGRSATWLQRATEATDSYEVLLKEEDRSVEAGGGYNSHRALDRGQVDSYIPELGELYAELTPLLRSVISPYLVSSPYSRTAYYVKFYDGPVHQQGWHYDTNSVTALLYLTSHPDGDGSTEIHTRDERVIKVVPQADTLLLLNGRKCWHRANRVQANSSKVVVILDFYLLGHRLRAPHLDRLIFSGSPTS